MYLQIIGSERWDSMSKRLQPVSTNDFRKKLKKNGFQYDRSNTGHEIWERKQSISIPVHNNHNA